MKRYVIDLYGFTDGGLTSRARREQAESGLQFLGLIIFENKLKAGTAPAIQVLQNAHLALRMATGDNHRTAISVARECGLIGQSMHVFVPSFATGNAQTPASVLAWTSIDDELFKLDPYSLKPLSPSHRAMDADDIDYQDYTLAITGDVFRWMINNSPLETLQRVSLQRETPAVYFILTVIWMAVDVCQRANLRSHVSRRKARASLSASDSWLYGRLLWRRSE